MNRDAESVAAGLWREHYPAGPGSIAEQVVVPWERVTGQSRREYLEMARALQEKDNG